VLWNGRTGFNFAVTAEGAGDATEPIERADDGLTVADVVRLYTVDAENQDLRRATQTSRLPGSWKDYFPKRL
jgi:MOSC domain-containing protein YiiM